MRSLTLHRGSVYLFGKRFPVAVVAILAVTLLATLVGAVGLRSDFPLLAYVGLVPAAVWEGQLWRLFTWVFFVQGLTPISLLFLAIMLLVFGRDLCDAWGSRRFVLVYLGLAGAAGVLTCLIARAVGGLMMANYLDCSPVIDGLVIAWALMFPTRQILFNFVIPVSGKSLIWITVGVTVFFALLSGIGGYVPHLCALAAAYAYMRGTPFLRRQWVGARLRGREATTRRRPGHIRPVDEPPEKPRWYH